MSADTVSFFSVPNAVVLVAGVVLAPKANPAKFALLELESLELELSDLLLPKANPPAVGLAAVVSDPTPLENIELESLAKAPNWGVDVLLSPTFGVDVAPKENPPVDLDSLTPLPILNAEESPLSPSVFLSPKANPEVLLSVLPATVVLFVAPAPNLNPDIGDEVVLVVLSLLEPNWKPPPAAARPPPPPPPLSEPNLNAPAAAPAPNTDVDMLPLVSGLDPGFGVSQAAHFVLSEGLLIIQTSHAQVPALGLNMVAKSPPFAAAESPLEEAGEPKTGFTIASSFFSSLLLPKAKAGVGCATADGLEAALPNTNPPDLEASEAAGEPKANPLLAAAVVAVDVTGDDPKAKPVLAGLTAESWLLPKANVLVLVAAVPDDPKENDAVLAGSAVAAAAPKEKDDVLAEAELPNEKPPLGAEESVPKIKFS